MEMKEFNNVENERIRLLLNILDDYHKYIDENNIPYIFIGNNSYTLNSIEFKQELQSICFDNNINYTTTLINKVVGILSSKIRKDANKLELDYRIAKDINGDFLYQLTKDEMVVINENGYKIAPILKATFKVDNTFTNQVKPSNKPSMKRILDVLNLNEEDKKLLQVLIISLFIPDIQKASLVLASPTGTGKSTITDIIKRIVDPTPNKKVKAPKSLNELEQIISKSYLPCFDNIDYISTEQSNVLCRAITGDTHIKYEKNKTITSSYTRPIILNGIKCPVYKEDLIDRLVIIEPPTIITPLTREEIDKIIDEELPNALAYIFNTLSKAKDIYKDLQIDIVDRMADWYKWAYAIAEAIEYGSGWMFESLFRKNRNKQTDIILSNNPITIALKEFVNNGGVKFGERLKLTSTELYNILQNIANEKGLKIKGGVVWCIRCLKPLVHLLYKDGIVVEFFEETLANGVILSRKSKE